MPMLVKLVKRGNQYVADRYLRASDFADGLGQANNPEWKTLAIDEASGKVVSPQGSIGYRWGQIPRRRSRQVESRVQGRGERR